MEPHKLNGTTRTNKNHRLMLELVDMMRREMR